MKRSPFILATVGSTDFDDLVEAVDRAAARLGATGLLQIGPGRYEPKNLPHQRFVPSLAPVMAQADVVVSHGGAATTLEVLNRRIPLVSVTNPDRYDDHQSDLLAAMSASGHLLWCRSLDQLDQSILDALERSFRPIEPVDCRIGDLIEAHLRRRRGGPRRQRWRLRR